MWLKMLFRLNDHEVKANVAQISTEHPLIMNQKQHPTMNLIEKSESSGVE